MEHSICIVDFCGRSRPDNFPATFSSDYFPADGLAYFTGDWGAEIPPMPCSTEPSEADVYAWARSHGGVW